MNFLEINEFQIKNPAIGASEGYFPNISSNISILQSPSIASQPIAISWNFDYFVPDENGGGTQVDIEWIDIEITKISNGQIVHTQRQFGNSNSMGISIPTGGFPPGVYLIRIRTNTGHVFSFIIYIV